MPKNHMQIEMKSIFMDQIVLLSNAGAIISRCLRPPPRDHQPLE
jgi:hypothetical protein